MRIIQTITAGLAIAAAFISSLFSWGDVTMIPFKNDYQIPEALPEYSVISTEAKTDWSAEWIWDKENLTEKNVWMCFDKRLSLKNIPKELIAHISADSKYWLYINGETVVYEGNVKRGPDKNSGYYDSVDISPYLKEGENRICALVYHTNCHRLNCRTGHTARLVCQCKFPSFNINFHTCDGINHG